MNEYQEWRDIPGYEGLYQASDLGNIRSLRRLMDKSATSGLRILKKVLKFGKTEQGRLQVTLSRQTPGERYTTTTRYLVHRLVYAAFNGPIPDSCDVRHEDKNYLNNIPSNLVLGGTQRGAHRSAAQLTEDAVLLIRHSKARQADLAKEYGISQAAVSHIRNFKTWKHLTRQPIPTPSLFDDQE